MAERLLQQSAPLLLLILGLFLLLAASLLRAQTFLRWIAAGIMLSGSGLALQSLLTDASLARTAPVVAVLYLAGAAAVTQGVALRCGDGKERLWITGAAAILSILTSFCFSYIIPNLAIRMIALNTALWVIFLAQVPYLLRDWAAISRWDRILGFSLVMVAMFHLLRAGYIGFGAVSHGIASGFLNDLTASLQWKLLLAASNIMSLCFGLVALLGAIEGRIAALHAERDRDPLTGLLNRRGFEEAARLRLPKSHRSGWFIATADVDFFKKINDTYGHAAGDQALVRIAQLLAHEAGPQDLVARFGGEEFVMLLHCRDIIEATARAEQMRLLTSMTMVPGLPTRITASFGLAPVTGEGVPAALADADAALYRAKAAGRNRVSAAA